MKKAKSPVKGIKQRNTPKSQFGMGDYYGTGVKNPEGKARDVMGMKSIGKSTMKKKPKALA